VASGREHTKRKVLGQRRQQQQQQQQHAGASTGFSTCGGHSNDTLAFAVKHSAEWSAAASKFVHDMHACSWCARVALG
jgi:hypothetical protein